MISVIVVCDSEYGIGRGGKMPWHFPADFAYFKKKTMGHPMITGRKNFEDMGALPGRETIVVTRDVLYRTEKEGVHVAHSLEEALVRAQDLEGKEEIFIVGGGQMYRHAFQLGMVDTVYVTHIQGEGYECDTFFSKEYLEQFEKKSEELREADDQNPRALIFTVYEKA